MKTMTLCMALFCAGIANAQATVVTDDVYMAPKFFIAIIAGVVLALAFQFILTALSVASGITAIGDVREHFVKASNHTGNNSSDDSNEHEFNQDYNDHDTNLGVKVTTGFGIWSVITTCIALFGATALALNLSVWSVPQTDITIALVIWAVFFILLFYLESKVVNSVLGGLINTATSGLKASAGAVSNLFAPSDSQKMDKVISSTIDRIKQEVNGSMDMSEISTVLDNFLTKVDNKLPDYDHLKADLENIANKTGSKNTSGKWMAIQQVLTKAIASKTDQKNKSDDENSGDDKVAKLKGLLKEIQTNYGSADSKTEGIKKLATEYTNLSEADIDEQVNKIKNLLETSKPEGLDTASVKSEIQKVLKDPKMIGSLLSKKAEGINRASIIEALDKNTNFEKSQLERYADLIEENIEKVKSQFGSSTDEGFTKQIEGRIANFLNSTQRDEIQYDELKRDVLRIIDNPKDSMSVIKSRLNSMNKDTIKALVTNNRYVDESQLDKISQSIEDSKKQVLDKVKTIETKTHQQVEILKRKAVIQAEHTRKTAASAAWWLVITAVLSAGAAIAGSLVA